MTKVVFWISGRNKAIKNGSLFGKYYIKIHYLAHIIHFRNPDGLQVRNVKSKIIEILTRNARESLKSCGGFPPKHKTQKLRSKMSGLII